MPNDNLSIHQWIFTKLGVCIDTVEIWFGIANGQMSSNIYGVICPRHDGGVLTFLFFMLRQNGPVGETKWMNSTPNESVWIKEYQ